MEFNSCRIDPVKNLLWMIFRDSMNIEMYFGKYEMCVHHNYNEIRIIIIEKHRTYGNKKKITFSKYLDAPQKTFVKIIIG